MIVDLRMYKAMPGQLGPWLKLYEEAGWALQRKYLPNCIGFYTVETGTINRVVHLWEYADIAERERTRAAMEQDPAWPDFRSRSGGYFVAQENYVMKPVPFWPMRPAADIPIGIVDKRTYHAVPGKLAEFYRIYEKEGRDLQVGHLGRCLGFYQSDIGPQHRIVHFWAYKDSADRDKRRAGMAADPAWQAYLAKTAPLFTHQENEILRPVSFWPAR